MFSDYVHEYVNIFMATIITQLDTNSIHLINRICFGPKLEWLKKDTRHILENRNSAREWLFATIEQYKPLSVN
ncbi:uncharacterized protein METZ01_LOCUS326263, partial [marine metagenome]